MKSEYLEEGWVTLKYEIKEYHMEFWVYEVAGKIEGVENFYEKEGAKSSEETTQKLEEAQTLFQGSVKWDGCSHLSFGDKDGYIHFCGGEQWAVMMRTMNRVWEIARENLSQEHTKEEFGELQTRV